MRECFGKYPKGQFPCIFCEDRGKCKNSMKKYTKDNKVNEYVVWFDNYDSIKISIKEDINRPNYTDDYQLIVDYIERTYGTQVYEIMELDVLEKVEL